MSESCHLAPRAASSPAVLLTGSKLQYARVHRLFFSSFRKIRDHAACMNNSILYVKTGGGTGRSRIQRRRKPVRRPIRLQIRAGAARAARPALRPLRLVPAVLVERASVRSGNKPVILVSHSQGGINAMAFLAQSPLPWRRRYVKHFVMVSTGAGGIVTALRALASSVSHPPRSRRRAIVVREYGH